jgi:TetR/AcrR family transcriptional regulator
MGWERGRFSAQDRRQQIIRVAMRLFAQRGFRGTTTRQIAERAGINEAIIFRHFRRKEDLYWAVIEEKCVDRSGKEEAPNVLGANGREREFFVTIAEDILRRNTRDTTLSRLLLFSALERHQLSHRFFRTYVAQYYAALAEHIRKRIREGSFRRVDPLLAARGFLGMVIYHFLTQELFGGKRIQRFNPSKVSDTMTDIWLEGMHVRRGQRSRPSSVI